jgi:AraC family transcriptional regulator, regulatory protein of adaptative response / DNA-3-methyladenine glycosylase II
VRASRRVEWSVCCLSAHKLTNLRIRNKIARPRPADPRRAPNPLTQPQLTSEPAATTRFLAARAVPGIEDATDGTYRRTVALAHGPAVIALDRVLVTADPRDDAPARAAIARLAGADPTPADAHLARDPHLGPLVAARPGLRMPGTVDGGELAVRAVLGQQVSLAAARTLAGRLVAAAGEPLPEPVGALTHTWPRPEAIAEAAPRMPMPRSRQRALAALAGALADGLRLEPGTDPALARAALLELPGIGPWTAEYVAMRALADPDAWLPTDLGVRHGLAHIGAPTADPWRPHRTHAVRHLWDMAAGSA